MYHLRGISVKVINLIIKKNIGLNTAHIYLTFPHFYVSFFFFFLHYALDNPKLKSFYQEQFNEVLGIFPITCPCTLARCGVNWKVTGGKCKFSRKHLEKKLNYNALQCWKIEMSNIYYLLECMICHTGNQACSLFVELSTFSLFLNCSCFYKALWIF